MKKPFTLISTFLVLLSISSCVEDVDNTRSSGLYSASASEFTTLDIYDLGSTNEVELSIAKAGLEDNGGTVTFSVEENLLDSVNNINGTSYKLLPSECYTLENATFSVAPGGDRRVIGGKLIYDPHKIYEFCGFENVKYVLPLHVSSTGTPMNPDRTNVLYAFNIKKATINLTSAGGDFEVKDGTTSSPMTLSTEVKFNNEWDLTTSFGVRSQEFVDEYNTTNSTFFIPLPTEAYTVPELTIAKGKQAASATIDLKAASLSPGNYILPLSINGLSGQGDASISFNPEEVTIFSITKLGTAIDRSNWKISASTEEKTGEGAGNGCAEQMIDGNKNTFWHSQWQGGEVPPPYEIILDMGKVNVVSQLGLIARQNSVTKMNLEIYAGNDGSTWNLIGKYHFDGNTKTEQYVPVKACKTRYLRLYIPTLDGATVGHMAELYIYGTDK